MPIRTAKFLLVEERLGRDLIEFLIERRDDKVTFERIARELWIETGVDVTSQTVSNWCADHSPTDGSAVAS